jgi:hypothetical protein
MLNLCYPFLLAPSAFFQDLSFFVFLLVKLLHLMLLLKQSIPLLLLLVYAVLLLPM